MTRVPVFQDSYADFEQEIELGGQLVKLRITYNIRISHFFLVFTDQEGNIIYGLKIVPNWLLLDSHKGFTEFVGDLIVKKIDNNAEDVITYSNFGSGWALYYYDEDEVVAWREENGI